ncbi:MAG TPA: hypothetical protein VF516_34130 [Kofleriaceae bacterium]
MNIAVIVDYLRDGEPAAQQILAVRDGGRDGSGALTKLAVERLFEPPQEQRDPLFELQRGRGGTIRPATRARHLAMISSRWSLTYSLSMAADQSSDPGIGVPSR